ncbi:MULTISPECIES: CBS domain-containing protein [unclassified Agarivorans]|uniref:CBS domain-containing protein n=1 Tax=unclassified Agarivorans TaxID=2636026 RepID=UPI0010D70935|nr:MULTISPECIES: CBS domain-containing protein [unclassified Agarivorans]MDO6688026.1 CBS domain-containing protein [Agarivorans sp. 3_MG-2023]MDO6715293.1 CBS domain-containing protein [Agarivorans sp. 2_MG-2023]MDO6763399.1 CBS domain-containing protein [Agarivorans sp. 1_MG-2023]GDY26243.1 CBS domain-containing protein [Agarivorans sp. Toyoura001]
MQQLNVRHYMRTQLLSFTQEQSINQASDALTKSQQLGAPVVDAKGALIGWLSELDCVTQMLQAGYYCDQSALVKDIMRTEVLSVGPDENILDLAKSMTDNKPKSYPVVENGKLLGLIERKAVLAALHKQQQQCFSVKQ